MVWRKIEGFEYYEVSDNGRVRSLPRIVPCRGRFITKRGGLILKPGLSGRGYEQVCLWLCNNVSKQKYVHRLVAEAFLPNPNNKPEVNHIDGNKRNNELANLEWVTASENQQHSISMGLRLGKKHKNVLCKPYDWMPKKCKLSFLDAIEIKKWYYMGGITIRSLAKKYNVSVDTVRDLLNGKRYTHL